MATTIETDLKEILDRIDKRLGAIESDVTTIKIDIATLKAYVTTVKEDVKDLRGSQRSQIWVLIVAVVGAIIKFGFFPNP